MVEHDPLHATSQRVASLDALRGFAMLWIIDVKGYRKWAFFLIVIRMNSITIWVGQRCIDFGYTAGFLFNGILPYTGVLKPVLAAFSVLLLKGLFLYFLHRHRIYLKA